MPCRAEIRDQSSNAPYCWAHHSTPASQRSSEPIILYYLRKPAISLSPQVDLYWPLVTPDGHDKSYDQYPRHRGNSDDDWEWLASQWRGAIRSDTTIGFQDLKGTLPRNEAMQTYGCDLSTLIVTILTGRTTILTAKQLRRIWGVAIWVLYGTDGCREGNNYRNGNFFFDFCMVDGSFSSLNILLHDFLLLSAGQGSVRQSSALDHFWGWGSSIFRRQTQQLLLRPVGSRMAKERSKQRRETCSKETSRALSKRPVAASVSIPATARRQRSSMGTRVRAALHWLLAGPEAG